MFKTSNENSSQPWNGVVKNQECAEIFTRKSLRYVRVFAVAIPSVCRLSVTLVHPTQGVKPFRNISSPLCTLAILWPSRKIIGTSSQGNPSIGGDKHKRGTKIQVQDRRIASIKDE